VEAGVQGKAGVETEESAEASSHGKATILVKM